MSESDMTRDYLFYGVDVLRYVFRHQKDVYVSGNLFIYYEEGVSDAVVSPDVFVIFGVSKQKRRTYKVWEENGKTPSWIMEVTSASSRNTDSIDKPQKYARMGVTEYFQYDPTGDYLKPHQLKGFRLVGDCYEPIAPQFLSDGVLSIYSEVLGLELRLISGELRFYDRTTQILFPPNLEVRENIEQLEQQRYAAEQQRDAAEQQRYAEAKARRDAIPKLLEMGLTVEQVAQALGLSINEVQGGI